MMLEAWIISRKGKAPSAAKPAAGKVLASGVFGTLKPPPERKPEPAPPSRSSLP
jgi:hypothetical protein